MIAELFVLYFNWRICNSHSCRLLTVFLNNRVLISFFCE
jgi:hypothetical protein